MLILFTGGRGSGKSTIGQAFYDICAQYDIAYIHQSSYRKHLNTPLQKIFFYVSSLRFFNFAIVRAYMGRVVRDVVRGNSVGMYRLYFPLIFSYNLAQLEREDVDVLIYDTDTLSWITDTVLAGTFNTQGVRDFYLHRILPKAGKLLIVMVNTPIEESIQRSSARDMDAVQAGTQERMQWQEAREKVVEAIADIPSVDILQLNGLDTPEGNAQKIWDQVRSAPK